MRYSILFIFVFVTAFGYSQGWKRHFRMPNTGNNYTKAIFETAPGHYLAFGTSIDTTNGGYCNKLRVLGLNSNGQLVWSKQYGDTNLSYYDNFYGIPFGYKNGNDIYFVGTTQHGTKVDGGLMKFNSYGDTLWQRIYTDSVGIDVSLLRMNKSLDGGFLLTGFSQNWNNHTNPCLIIKTNSTGQELWRKKIHKTAPDFILGYAIVQDSATKNIIIGGLQRIGNNFWNTYDNILILDSLGNKLSQNSTMGMGSIMTDLIQTKDKSIVAVGAKTYSMIGLTDAISRSYIFKFDISNPSSQLWLKEYQEPGQLSSYNCVQELPNGDLLVGGGFDTSYCKGVAYDVSICIDRWDKNGNLLKQNRYHYPYSGDPTDNNQALLCLNPTSDGGYVGAIQTLFFTPRDKLFYVKYDSLLCDSSQAYCAMILAEVQSINLNNTSVNIYPNPASWVLHIKLGEPPSEILYAGIIDLYGREIKRLKLEQTTDFEIKELRNSMYFLNIMDSKNKLLHQVKFLKQD